MTLPIDSRSRDPSERIVEDVAGVLKSIEAKGAVDGDGAVEGIDMAVAIDAIDAIDGGDGIHLVDANGSVNSIRSAEEQARSTKPRAERAEDAGTRARWAARFGQVRWYTLLGAIAGLAIAGIGGAAVAGAGVDEPGGMGPIDGPDSAAKVSAGSDAHSASVADDAGLADAVRDAVRVAGALGALVSADNVVATVTPPGGPTIAPPVATVTPFGGTMPPPVATITPPGAPVILAVTVTPSAGGGPGTASPSPSPSASSTPLATGTGDPSLTPVATGTGGPGLTPTPTADATFGPITGRIYLPLTLKHAGIGGP